MWLLTAPLNWLGVLRYVGYKIKECLYYDVDGYVHGVESEVKLIVLMEIMRKQQLK